MRSEEDGKANVWSHVDGVNVVKRNKGFAEDKTKENKIIKMDMQKGDGGFGEDKSKGE